MGGKTTPTEGQRVSKKEEAQDGDCKLKKGKVHARKAKSVRDRRAYKGD